MKPVLSYALNERNGKVHLVSVSRGSSRTDERCQVDDMSDPPRLVSTDEAWALFRENPASWCGVCLDDPRRSPGANEIDTGIEGAL